MLTTSIGSLPFIDVTQALDAVFEFCPRMPFWPQLPKRSFYERMYVQCLEGIPSVVVDEQTETMYVDTRKTEGLERFYEDVHDRKVSAFSISDRAAPGLYGLLDRLPYLGGSLEAVKVQLVGPFTLGMGLKDENGKPIMYDAAFFDVIKKALRMKAEWLINAVRTVCPEKQVVLFFDEPGMTSFGSAFVAVSQDDATRLFNETCEGLDATVGIHCCGNTDWPVLLKSEVDLINYDAFGYMETLFYFGENLTSFLLRGGEIAPGIVPSTSEALADADADQMSDNWQKYRRLFEETGQSRRREIVTTACGLGSLTEAEAKKALRLLRRLSDSNDD
jgi:methionine synthase II (cobalamin-independent)